MIDKYEMYCLADPLFYDTLDNQRTRYPDYAIAGNEVPAGWQHRATETWLHYVPEDNSLPLQGWKIHVSSCLEDAERTLEAVWDYCVGRRLPFKFLRGPRVVIMLNSKYADRGSSGKLVTIYPSDENEMELVLKELGELLHGVRGPYILSDLRIGEGPLFVRYGGFAERYCLTSGRERVLAIEDADGVLVPDRRGPTFSPPPWITLPDFLEPHLAARNAVTVGDLPYKIEKVLHFSNGGGVYKAVDTRTGEVVVLKEARPHAGLDAIGRDAVARLQYEAQIMRRLEGLRVVPAIRDYFTLGDHHFLVEEFIDGTTLSQESIHRHPLTRAHISDEDAAEFTEWALDMLARVDEAVSALHERGVVFGDLHPFNILVEGDRVVLIDFEVATLAEQKARPTLAHPGFCPPPDRLGVEADKYAQACLRLGLFAPMSTVLIPLHRAKAIHLAEMVRTTFPVPREFVDEAVRTILGDDAGTLGAPAAETSPVDAGRPAAATERTSPASATQPPAGEVGQAASTDRKETPAMDAAARRPGQGTGSAGRTAMRELPMPGRASWEEVRAAACRAIVASATPDRADRLFPGDVVQFQPGGGLNLATGAAGVLYALAVTGAGRFPEYEAWLKKHALAPRPGTGLGFYDGLHGVAYAFDALGDRQGALDLVALLQRERWEQLGQSLYAGLSGIGLNLLHFGRTAGEPSLVEAAVKVTGMVADRLGSVDSVPEVSGGTNPHAGLLRGSSGPALLFLRVYEATGDPSLLDHAAVALRQDLRRCTHRDDGQLQVQQGWRTNPYLDEGSAGIGLILAQYLAHREDEEFRRALGDIAPVATLDYYVQSGLFAGRGGMISALCAGIRPGVDRTSPLVADQIRRLAWHAIPYGDGLAFPGNQLLRLSMDLASGTAGVVFALGTALHDQPVHLPFISPPGNPAGPVDSDQEGR
ncbi:class III lanthionine synthetase LanKC [Sphaerisporangium sp. TRM90804]|uniref:class III lanthionine synthetase LanKC n=1 Tax=Sphaerisporangium sp. TRM90804 TaxID=3031113 RepID=UPI00244D66BF|nr:class III lanthionine synthetase LanKC [Sphaerisporangium sp. TRM90804]MDH2424405.1 class III lanthionine synthetase LanKC [Sphaerisporangium sp. TRM90804]